jgi:predicted amidohydrolase YtcJ
MFRQHGAARQTGAFLVFLMMMAVETNGQTKSAGTLRSEASLPRGADLVLLHGKVWTGEPESQGRASPPFAEAVAIAAGRILDVGTDEQITPYIGRRTRVLDMAGRGVVPGFIDGHAHFFNGGFQLLAVDLRKARSEEEFVRRIAAHAARLAPGRWVLGGGWDEEAWAVPRLPHRGMIDAVTAQHPVLVTRYDEHTALANSLALKLAGITEATPDPAGGVIVRDPGTGEPTGVVKDAAITLIANSIPRFGEAEMEEALRAALAEARRCGVTSVQNITIDSDLPNCSFTEEIKLLRRAETEGWLTCRLYEIIPLAKWKDLVEAGLSRGMGSEFLRLGAVKAFADGSLGSRTAWMFEPFDDDPGNSGLPMELMSPPSRMKDLARRADEAGLQLAIHAIGDRAIAELLEIYQDLGGGKPETRRYRIEHAQHVRPQDFARFERLGVIASMQPYHAIDDGRWAEKRIGSRRARSSYAWRSMLDAGAHLAFGSDWPVAPLNPLLGVYAAVTRATLDGKHPGGWIPSERLTVVEALRAYTSGSAYAAFEEKEKGRIAPGLLADLVILSDDLFQIPSARIRDIRVEMTIVGGNLVYEAPSASPLQARPSAE